MKRQSPDPTAGRFVERRPGLLISQARNPLLQNCLAARLNCDEGDSHPRVRLGVNDLAECGETFASSGNGLVVYTWQPKRPRLVVRALRRLSDRTSVSSMLAANR